MPRFTRTPAQATPTPAPVAPVNVAPENEAPTTAPTTVPAEKEPTSIKLTQEEVDAYTKKFADLKEGRLQETQDILDGALAAIINEVKTGDLSFITVNIIKELEKSYEVSEKQFIATLESHQMVENVVNIGRELFQLEISDSKDLTFTINGKFYDASSTFLDGLDQYCTKTADACVVGSTFDVTYFAAHYCCPE